MRKILALVALSGSFAFALGLNCLPNFPAFGQDFWNQITGALGQ